MGRALINAAEEAGIRITLLDACYLHGGIGEPASEAQRRFSDGHAEAWVERVGSLRDEEGVRIGAAIHSVRAVDPGSAATVAAGPLGTTCAFRAHVSEQPAENRACLGAYGRAPTGLLEESGALTGRFTAVHATHLDDADVARIGAAGAALLHVSHHRARPRRTGSATCAG